MPTLTFHPSAVLEDMCSVESVDSSHPYSNVIGQGTDSSKYAQWYMVKGGSARTKVYYSFDLSAIPANAIITSVICKGKCQSQNNSILRGGNTTLSLYSGTTEMASTANQAFGTSAKIVELPQVSWTREQLTDCRILIHAARGLLNTNTSYYIRCFGIDLTVTYEIPVYYTVTITINGGTLKSPTTENMTVLSGDDCEITFNGNDEYIYSSMTVNGISVSPTTKTESGKEYYSYTISAVDGDKTVVIIFNETDIYYIKINGQWRKVLTAYRRVNGVWETFDYVYDDSLQLKYLGHITSDIIG